MPIIVYFENANNSNGEKDEYGLVTEGGGSYAEYAALYEDEPEYGEDFEELVKQALDANFNMITESVVSEDDNQLLDVRECLGLGAGGYSPRLTTK